MPLGRYQAQLFLELSQRFPLQGALGAVGRLHPSILRRGELRALFREAGRTLPASWNDAPDDGLVDEREFAAAFGLTGPRSIDRDGYEGAEILQDLNLAPPAAEHHELFDVLYNNGSMEHVFHLPHFLRNCFHFLKPGGIVIHSTPSNNQVEHGFYQFSPTFFWDYYTVNRYRVLGCLLVRHAPMGQPSAPTFTDFCTFDHPRPDPLYGTFGTEIRDVVFAAQKTEESLHDQIPTQFRYARRTPRPG
ncbi:MAG: hypothetical protein HQL51_09550 [Magnetococcales bacterium]|nr:hypothetical protein [Magnetococcales bacterium]